MIRGVSCSNSRVAVCACALGSLAFACAARHHFASLWDARLRQAAASEGFLVESISGLGGCEAADLEALRRRVSGMRTKLGEPDAWKHLEERLGKGWRREPGTREERDGYSVFSGSLVLSSPTTADWPRILDAVKAIGEVPGAGIVGFEMATSGGKERRNVDVARVFVTTQTRKTPKGNPDP